jgi:ATP-binding cassette subfamily B multidrug efflux pump
MLKLIKHLKPYGWLILAVFVLLFGQAMADLSLPGYMADIVNVGIQQHGIQNAVPKAIRSSEFNKATLFMTDSEKAQVTADYILLDKEALSPADYAKYVKTYPNLANEPVYILNTGDKTEISRLDGIFNRYLAVVSTIESAGDSIFSGTSIEVPAGTDPFTILTQLPSDQLGVVRDMVTSQMSNVPGSMLTQYSIAYVAAEYKAIGMNLTSVQTAYMLRIGGLMLLLTLASVGAAIVVVYLSAKIGSGLGRDLRRKLFVKIESFSNTEFDKFSTASLITRSTNDITQIQLLMIMVFRFVFYAPILGVGGILKVLATDSSMLWIIGAAVAAMLLLMIIAFIVALPKFRSIQNLVDRLNLVTREFLSGLMVVRAFNNQHYEEKKFDAANIDLTRVNLFINRLMAILMPIMMLVMNGVMLLIIWVGASQVDAGNTQIGNMMAFMQYAMLIIFAFLMVTMIFIMLPRASVSAGRIDKVLETDPAITDPEKPQQFKDDVKGLVEFQNVSFRYPGAQDDVVKNVTFTANPGQTTAVIGSTGSGKTTLINLIPRFYDVTAGQVLIDGVDIRKVKQYDLREKIGYASQKAVLFSGTIESNIRYADENASDAEVAKYAEIAQALEFINTNDKGFEMPVSQGGTNLSGGQKQRLAIARALAKKPEIYIFDDSLSALDFRTDAALRKSLKKETSMATVIIVTQRVSTIMGAEKIVVMDNGEVVGIGTHKELMKSCNVYREIAQSQLSQEELA